PSGQGRPAWVLVVRPDAGGGDSGHPDRPGHSRRDDCERKQRRAAAVVRRLASPRSRDPRREGFRPVCGGQYPRYHPVSGPGGEFRHRGRSSRRRDRSARSPGAVLCLKQRRPVVAPGQRDRCGGRTPPPGHAARFVVGGAGEWAAIGPDSIWTSADDQAWTLTSATGLPQQAGDQITMLKRTGSGFITAGANVPNGNQAAATPVIFLSANGINWHRLGAGQLHLAAGQGRALDLRLATADGQLILNAGDSATPTAVGTGRSRHMVTVRTGGAWLSDDDGRSWTPASVPAGRGETAEFSDAAASGAGFLRGGGGAVTGAGAVLAAGMSTAQPGNGQQLITVTAAAGGARSLSLSAIPGAVEPQLAVNAVAAQGGTQVAVGSANGFPAAWISADGGRTWQRGT